MITEDFESEKRYIYETARINGYQFSALDRIFEKHQHRQDIRNLLLGSSKDKLKDEGDKSGNMIECEDCDAKYIGQIQQNI
jgi:hypothetical protein